MTYSHLYLMTFAAIVGCAGRPAEYTETTTRGRTTLLTDAEIAAAHADQNTAYDAVARLRPSWLAARGVTSFGDTGGGTEYALVYLDGQRFGDLNSMKRIPGYHVASMQYYDITQAGAMFGIRGGASGVIDIKLKGPHPQ